MPQRPVNQPSVEDRIDEVGRRRLTISVPRPRAMLNLGMPWFERLRGTTFDNSTNRFGYQGASLLSEYYFFGYIEKDTLLHTKKTTQLQTEKKWLQYSGDSQWIATKKNATFAVEHKMTLVAGAGQGPITPPTFGMNVRTDPYNNLELHYCVDSVMNGVAEFFLGRRTRETEGLRHSFKSTSPKIQNDTGFHGVIERAKDLLGPSLLELAATRDVFAAPSNDSEPNLHFGYGKPYFTDFDPYAKKEPSGDLDLMAHLKSGFSDLNRTLDVMMKLGSFYENIPVLRDVAKLCELYGDLGDAIEKVGSQLQRLGTDGSSDNRGDLTIPDNVYSEMAEWVRSAGQAYEDTPSPSTRRAEVVIRRPPWGWGAVSAGSRAQVSVQGPGGPFIEPEAPVTGGESRALSNEEILAALRGAGYEVSMDPATGDLVFRSRTDLAGTPNRSFLSVGGRLLEDLLGPDPSPDPSAPPATPRAAFPIVSRVPRGNEDWNRLETVSGWLQWVGSLPPDPAGLFAPVVDTARQMIEGVEKVTKFANEWMEAIGGTHAGAKPARGSIGIFANDGISLGTPDRLVSAAGRGYIFVADGGTGDADVSKYVPGENLVNYEPIEGYEGLADLGGTAAAKAPKDGGFAVFSNSTTSLVTRTSLDLLAVGSQKEGNTLVGRGVARLAATDSVEVAGHRRVTISATSGASWQEPPAEDGDGNSANQQAASEERTTAALTSDELPTVELLGDCLRLGSATRPGYNVDGGHQIPWPTEPSQEGMRTLEYVTRHVAPATRYVDMNASQWMQIHLGSHTGPDGEEPSSIRDGKAEEERLRAHRALLLASNGGSGPEAPGKNPPSYIDSRLMAVESKIEQAVKHLDRQHDELRYSELAPMVEITTDHIKLGFRAASSPSTWGGHVFITKDSVQIAGLDGGTGVPTFTANGRNIKLTSGNGSSYIKFDAAKGSSRGLETLE